MAQVIKRVFDFLAAALGLIILSPLLLVTAALIWLTMGRPVLFRQVRPGYKERPFTMFKFRSMREAFNKEGQSLPDKERLTPLGRLLRKASIDELPELWNVIRGDMSLVGPRPLLTQYTPYLTKHELHRYDVRPGITGWAQIHGRNEASWGQRLSNDVRYVESWSLCLDLQILLLTAIKVVSAAGAVADPRSTMLNLDEERADAVVRCGGEVHGEQ